MSNAAIAIQLKSTAKRITRSLFEFIFIANSFHAFALQADMEQIKGLFQTKNPVNRNE